MRENESSFQPPSAVKRVIKGSLLPADKTFVRDLMETYKGPSNFVDFCYSRMREVGVFVNCIWLFFFSPPIFFCTDLVLLFLFSL